MTITTVGKPSDPVLWMLLSFWGAGVDVAWGGGVVVEGSCLEVVEDSEVVEVELGLGFAGVGLEGCDGEFVCDVVEVVEDLGSVGTEGVNDEAEF